MSDQRDSETVLAAGRREFIAVTASSAVLAAVGTLATTGAAADESCGHLNRAWHRLSPWPDSVGGLNRLKTRYTLSTLSNGNVSLLVDMAKNAGLPWDCVLSAEVFNHYKPDPEVYLGAAKLLGPKPGQVMMVAAHMDDLLAAKKLGLRTALVTRPLEFGPDRKANTAADGEGVVDIVASDFVDLAARLGA